MHIKKYKGKILVTVAFIFIGLLTLFIHTVQARKMETLRVKAEEAEILAKNNAIKDYLNGKGFPLTSEEVDYVLTLKHWRLLVALSAAESSFCKRLIDHNCFGLGGDAHYRHYRSFTEAFGDADAFIESWQVRGKWLTVSEMNGSYVVPYNPNWEKTVNKVLSDLNAIEK